MRSVNNLSANRILALLIEAGEIRSLNYNGAGTPPYALLGTRIDLLNGNIQTRGLFTDGATGDVSILGDITARTLTVLEAGIAAVTFGPTLDAFGNAGFGLKRVFLGTDDPELQAALHFQRGPAVAETQIFTRGPSNDELAYVRTGSQLNFSLVDCTAQQNNGAVVSGAEMSLTSSSAVNGAVAVLEAFDSPGNSASAVVQPLAVILTAAAVEIPTGLLRVGDDLEIADVNIANTWRLRGRQVTTTAQLQFGNNGANVLGQGSEIQVRTPAGNRFLQLTDTGDYWYIANTVANGFGYCHADNLIFRSAGSVIRMQINASGTEISQGHLTIPNGARLRNPADSSSLEVNNSSAFLDADSINLRTSAGVARVLLDSTGLQSSAVPFICAYDDPGATQTWTAAQFRAQDSERPRMAYWNTGVGVAPQVACPSGAGEHISILNNPGNNWVPILASAFTVSSSEAVKTNIATLDDAAVLDLLAVVPAPIRFDNAIAPHSIRPTQRFAALNERWQAKGRAPLRFTSAHSEGAEHDCSIDNCAGTDTASSPCSMMKNTRDRFGFSAEKLAAVLPAVAFHGDDGAPIGIAVDQLAALALASVAALQRRITELEHRLELLSTS